MRKGLWSVVLVLACITFASAQVTRNAVHMVPTGKGFGVPGSATTGVIPDSVHTGNGIDYHNGPIMPNTVNIYLIWYGNWKTGPKSSDSITTVNLVNAFAQNVSGTPFEMINSTYGDNTHDVTALTHMAGQVFLPTYPLGKNFSDSNISTIVGKVISLGKLPNDTNGVYFVLTTSDVGESSGFCSFYCGWHNHATLNGSDIKYSFIGNVDRCQQVCEIGANSPNNDPGGDWMVNIMSHELEEAISDPDLNAWYSNRSGQENADMCAYKWGTLLGGSVGNGGYNEQIGGKNFLLQMNWENARGGGCDNFLGGPFHSN